MRTRRELVAEVEELGRDLGEEISTDRLNNAALADLVERLRERLEAQTRPPAPPATGAQRAHPAATIEPPAPRPRHRPLEEDKPRPPPPIVHDTAPSPQAVDGAADGSIGGPPPPVAEQPKPPPRAAYYVAAGRSIVARGRVIGPLKPVNASDFPGGQKDLDFFVVKGAVVRGRG